MDVSFQAERANLHFLCFFVLLDGLDDAFTYARRGDGLGDAHLHW